MCGIAGIIAFRAENRASEKITLPGLIKTAREIEASGYEGCSQKGCALETGFLCGDQEISAFLEGVRGLKCDAPFAGIFADAGLQSEIKTLADDLNRIIVRETRILETEMGHLPAKAVNIMSGRIEDLKDAAWCLEHEIFDNVEKIKQLGGESPAGLLIYKQLNTILNSIDRLEVRGRDSAGVSLLFALTGAVFENFSAALEPQKLKESFESRLARAPLVNGGISRAESKTPDGEPLLTLVLTYKVAAEIGRLGDNVAYLRGQIQQDALLHLLVGLPHYNFTIAAHTRWASCGAITEANCHPLDNKEGDSQTRSGAIIHAALNGDIDNYLDLRAGFEQAGYRLPEEVNSDTKVIPLQIEKYILQGFDVPEAFRLALNDFEGSHAICMQTNLAPGKLFLAQKGSGQALFVGLSEDHYMASSEIYGLVEETPRYIKLEGEKGDSANGEPQGQILILNQESAGGLSGIESFYYDGTKADLTPEKIKTTQITSRDIDRQDFPHYFLKEISEAPASVAKTLQNRWKIKGDGEKRYQITLDESIVPPKIERALLAPAADPNKIRRIFFVGQGTAGVAAQACANIVAYYLNDPDLWVGALKSSELSGFKLNGSQGAGGMHDTLVIAISQSGTTTDTNRTIDLVRERGGHTMAIVNRRDSDITFKVDGVMYTSSGRDIEMSVASTKAFYAQIVSGAILGLYLADITGRRPPEFIAYEIQQLLALPEQMRNVLAMQKEIGDSARRIAVTKTYWAVVGSGPNKASADEIRIKLSELCYKTISSDFVEDKKHIDLSAEPVIIVCAAGSGGTVIGDIVKDTAIFHAHKATPIVIADEGEKRFDPYAADVFHVPVVDQHLAPIINTLAGHIWGYHAALAINEGSHFLYQFRNELQKITETFFQKGLDLFEIILEKAFKEKIVGFDNAFRQKNSHSRFCATLGVEASSDLTLLLKYLAGKLPATDFELDFGIKGTAYNMIDALSGCLAKGINQMARPVDAIKHQAKTVTVGTSRLSEKVEGLLFEALYANRFSLSQLINRNILVLKNLQNVVARIEGTTLYRIGGLNLLGEPTDYSTIMVIKKEGTSASIPSRVEKDNHLKGSKRIIVQNGNVYIGKGIKDGRSILIIPLISASPDAPNLIEHLLLLNISFKTDIPLDQKIKGLGGKYEHIKNIVQENSIPWEDAYLDRIAVDELFGVSAEKVGELIVAKAG